MVIVRTRKKNRYRGLAAVETALVFSLLFMLMLGVIRYGWLFLKAQQITNATRQGARLAIRPDANTDWVKTTIINMLSTHDILIGEDNITTVPGDISEPAVGESVTVEVRVPCANIDIVHIPLFTELEPDGWSLRASVTMAKEGF